MKIKKIIKLLECIEDGKLPRDMHELSTYTQGTGTWIDINEMDFVHVMRAFENMQDSLAEEVKTPVSQDNQIFALEEKVSQLLEEAQRLVKSKIMLKEQIKAYEKERQGLYRRLEEKSYNEVSTPRYVFSEVPNDSDGQRFTDDMKTYLNKARYTLRVRGQHIKDEYKGTGATAYGQSIEQSTHLRVYIEEK
tara:strand:- start:791 stop:1366 length:576 start_codon:yes stop_codon:yes gene_type:complete